MQINFLEDAEGQRLTKTFTSTEVRPYPNSYRFTSHHYEVTDLSQFLDKLKHHADAGHCLLKGDLSRPLENARRAGTTSALSTTHYLLLDLDFDEGFDSIDEFMSAIGMADVSYILHHSSSSGIRAKPGLRAHVVVMLSKPQPPALLKSWLQYMNLTVEALRGQCQLSANGFSLKWALDVTTCQNDKLIYIADPNVVDIDDPMAGKRFELHQRTHDVWTFPFRGTEFAALGDLTTVLINELRQAVGLPKKSASYSSTSYHGETFDYLKNPSRAAVTDVRKARGFVYVNLNGGDSWAYYYPEGKPDYLRNFKGEPIVKLRDIDPDYYASVLAEITPEEAPAPATPPVTIGKEGAQYWYIHDYATNVYYKCKYDGTNLTLTSSSKGDIQNDYGDRNAGDEIDIIPVWDVIFDPTTFDLLDIENRKINKYHPTVYRMSEYEPTEVCPPIISRVIKSLTVEDDMYEHFLDWLAHIWQTGTPAKTGFLFRGTTGTGKGTLFNEILRPLFGDKHCRAIGMETFSNAFNPWAEDALFVMLDEGEIEDRDSNQLINKLNIYITEDNVELHIKHRNTVPVKNYMNLIVATNNRAPLKLSREDRRWNVALAQEDSLKSQGFNVEDIPRIKDELADFAAFLTHREYDLKKIREPMNNDAREDLFLATETSIEQIFRAFKEGDLDYFCEYVELKDKTDVLDPLTTIYNKTIQRWLEQIDKGKTIKMANAEARAIYQFLTNSKISPSKFGSLCNKKWTQAKTVRDGEDVYKGWEIDFKLKEPRWRLKLLETKKLMKVVA